MTLEVLHADSVTEIRPMSFVSGFHEVRPLNAAYLDRLRAKVREIGVKPYPLSVTPDGILFGGRHRFEAFKAEGLVECLMHVHQPDNLDREAIELNKASEDALPMTFVDYAELVWKRLADGATQQQTADGIGWSRTAVANYAALKAIDSEAWAIVTTYQQTVTSGDDDAVTQAVTTVTRLLFRPQRLPNRLRRAIQRPTDCLDRMAIAAHDARLAVAGFPVDRPAVNPRSSPLRADRVTQRCGELLRLVLRYFQAPSLILGHGRNHRQQIGHAAPLKRSSTAFGFAVSVPIAPHYGIAPRQRQTAREPSDRTPIGR